MPVKQPTGRAADLCHTTAAASKLPLPIILSVVLLAASPALRAQEAPDGGDKIDRIEVEGRQASSLTKPSTQQAREAIERIPGGVALVSDLEWRDTQAATMKDMLDFTPGVFVQPKWAGDSRLSIRGSGLSRYYHLRGISLYQDGVPLNNADGSSDFQWIDPTAYRYTEVYKGANGMRYGAGTLGGAINFVTPGGDDADRLRARADVGSFGWLRGHASSGMEFENGDGFITASAQQQDGFRDHSSGDSQRLSANLGWRLSPEVETRFYLTGLRARQELPGSLTRAQALEQPEQASAVNVADAWQHNVDGARLANRTVVLRDNTRYEFGGWLSYSELDHPIYEYLDHDRTDYGLYARLGNQSLLAGRSNHAVLGLTLSGGKNEARQFENHGGVKGAATDQVRNRAASATLYGENRLEISPGVSLIAGLQYLHTRRKRTDKFEAVPQSGSKSYDLLNPKLGVLWQPIDQVAVYANVSRSGEPPTFDDMQFDSRAALERLKPQRATTFELGTRGGHAGLSWDVSLYHARISNEFQCVSTAWNICDQTSNLDKTVHRGVEAGLSWALAEHLFGPADDLKLELAYTFSDFYFDRDPVWGKNRIPGVPRHYLRSELLYTHTSGLFIGPGLEWVPESFYVDNANSLKTASYALVGARAGWRSDELSLFIEGRNLADKNYITSASITDVAAPDAALFEPGSGRSVYVGVELTYH